MLFNPNAHTSGPTRLTDKDVHAVIVRCDYRPDVTTPNVSNGKALQMYFGVVDESAKGIILEKTFFIEGTKNDQAACNVLASVCRTVDFTEPLTEDNIESWCANIASVSGPAKIVTEPDPRNSKYRRLLYVNNPEGCSREIRDELADDIEAMRAAAAKNAERLALANGTQEDVAL